MDINISCDHSLGIMADMVTISVTPDYIERQCSLCKEKEILRRAGKIWTGYDIKAESFRDFERRKFAKEMLQPKDKHGNIDELYKHAYGNPYKKSKIGQQTDKYRIKDNKGR